MQQICLKRTRSETAQKLIAHAVLSCKQSGAAFETPFKLAASQNWRLPCDAQTSEEIPKVRIVYSMLRRSPGQAWNIGVLGPPVVKLNWSVVLNLSPEQELMPCPSPQAKIDQHLQRATGPIVLAQEPQFPQLR